MVTVIRDVTSTLHTLFPISVKENNHCPGSIVIFRAGDRCPFCHQNLYIDVDSHHDCISRNTGLYSVSYCECSQTKFWAYFDDDIMEDNICPHCIGNCSY